MNLSIRNMNHTVGERELETGIPLTTLEKLAAKLDVAQSLQKQTGWSEIISKGWEMEGDVFVALVDYAESLDVASTPKPHWMIEAIALEHDAQDWQNQITELRGG